MKAFIDDYGLACVVILVIVVLIGIIYFFKEPLQGYYEQILEDFFNKATDVSSLSDTVKSFIC